MATQEEVQEGVDARVTREVSLQGVLTQEVDTSKEVMAQKGAQKRADPHTLKKVMAVQEGAQEGASMAQDGPLQHVLAQVVDTLKEFAFAQDTRGRARGRGFRPSCTRGSVRGRGFCLLH